jgi:hypothetical protein
MGWTADEARKLTLSPIGEIQPTGRGDSPGPSIYTMKNQSVRSLKIEIHGDTWRGKTKPKIRLIGQWLESAGFIAGQRVQVVNTAPGILEIRASALSN